jgi:hypothetical protein
MHLPGFQQDRPAHRLVTTVTEQSQLLPVIGVRQKKFSLCLI